MKKYIIKWDIGFGESHEIIEAEDSEAAQKAAYDNAREEFESNVDYRCLGEATPELLEEYEGML